MRETSVHGDTPFFEFPNVLKGGVCDFHAFLDGVSLTPEKSASGKYPATATVDRQAVRSRSCATGKLVSKCL